MKKMNMKSISLIFINLMKLLLMGYLSSSLLVIASFCDDLAFAPVPAPAPIPYDFFYFVQTWPGSFGPKMDKKKVPNNFTIHGLWPQRINERMPDCPTTPNFQPLTSDCTRDELNRQWVALSRRDNKEFWKHEWEKHGTCSNDQFNQVQYLDTSLRLKRQYDILKILDAKDIKPGPNKGYDVSTIKAAIKEKIGYDPIVRCVKEKEKEKEKEKLYEIFLCVAKDGSKFEECKTSKEDIPIPIEEEEEYIAFTCQDNGQIIFPKIIWEEDNYCKMMIMK
ncbi:ribonuclease MC-like isoform X2 [Cannabis sativa]|uniref:ribonuclease MC-like isoform X2 n=1 Tax=Cannabis sativa TaxID=3483 RepID=UPI0029C9B469|nr:ribonuclease MC-like isoform X2 [Cannabis sativa]